MRLTVVEVESPVGWLPKSIIRSVDCQGIEKFQVSGKFMNESTLKV